MIFSVVLVILLSIGPICAMDSNIINDDSNLLSENNKVVFSSQNLEVSSYDSISETISHDDNVKNHSSIEDNGLLTSQLISDDIIQAMNVLVQNLYYDSKYDVDAFLEDIKTVEGMDEVRLEYGLLQE